MTCLDVILMLDYVGAYRVDGATSNLGNGLGLGLKMID